jgi:hypothetical protein
MAKSQGRRSLADLVAPGFIPTIEPTRKLDAGERAVWLRVLAAWPDNRWVISDAELLTHYCAVCAAFETARKNADFNAMAMMGRLCLTYATKMRLTPQSRSTADKTQVEAKRGRQNMASADRLLGGIARN